MTQRSMPHVKLRDIVEVASQLVGVLGSSSPHCNPYVSIYIFIVQLHFKARELDWGKDMKDCMVKFYAARNKLAERSET